MDDIQEIYGYFVNNYTTNIKNVIDSNIFYNTENISESSELVYTSNMHESICEKSFINIFLLWENFLENVFIAYLCGCLDLKNQSYQSYVSPKDKDHAYELLKGTKRYPDWTNLDEINILAELFFKDAGAFALLKNKPIEFTEMKTIRNKMSHMSKQSDKQYKRLLVNKIGECEEISVTQFLLRMVGGSNSTYFTYYSEFLMGYADIICNK